MPNKYINAAEFWNNHKEKIVFVLFLISLIAGYKMIQIFIPTGSVLKIPFIDDRIPFIPAFVIAYMCYNIILFMPFLLTFHDKNQFFAMSSTFLFAVIICDICYIFFQTMMIRPEIIPTTTLERWILHIYATDKPVNLLPSGHVTFTVLTTLCLGKLDKRWIYILTPITILIILSTLFIKQHYILDVAAGLTVAYIGYRFVFKNILFRNQPVSSQLVSE